MSLLDGCKKVTVDSFDGARPLLDVVDLSPGDAQLALNCKYSPGRVKTREGFAPAWTDGGGGANGYATSPFYWAYGDPTSPIFQYMAWGDVLNHKIMARDLVLGTNYTLKSGLSAGMAVASFASNGKRLYTSVAAGQAGNYPLGGAYVWDGNTSHTMDDCFQRPMKTTEVTLALTQPGAGVCSAGNHSVGVLFQTRAGYWTKPGPCDASIVLQPQIIASTGTNNIRATLTPATTWPTWIQAVQIIYTTTLNNFQYYVVPGTITTITAGSATVYTIDFNVADLQIRSIGSTGAGTLADDYFDLLSMDASNVAPFNVKFQISWGTRIVWFGNYGGVDTFFPSDQGSAEWISGNNHAKQLPGGLPIGAAFVLRGVLYVVSSAGGVYAYTDNGGRPVNFAPPQTIDTRISVQGNALVTVASSGGNAFLLADQGLYYYAGGAFPQIPLSFYQQPDIQIAGGSSVAIKDFPDQQTVFLQLYQPSGLGSVLYAINYQSGLSPEKIKASQWTCVAFPSNYPAIETVWNPTPGVWELWTAGLGIKNANGGFFRMKSLKGGDSAATLYSDFIADGTTETAINCQYQTSSIPQDIAGEVMNHIAVRVRATSLQPTGALSITVKNLDGTISVTPVVSPISITSTPGQRYLAFYDLQNEMASYLFTNGATVRNGIAISEFAHFYDLFAEQR